MTFRSKIIILVSFFSAAYAHAAPAMLLRHANGGRATTCKSWGVIAAGPYQLQSNLWGASNASSGSQCITFRSLNANTVAWNTSWTWTGGNQVKSFSNVQLNLGIGAQLSSISSMMSTWAWSHSSQGKTVADVAYDLFTSCSPTGNNEHEVMVWLANFHSGPISYQYDASGNAVPIGTNIQIANYKWNLYVGTNGANIVWSFLPHAAITAFTGDINLFLKYLTSRGYIPSSQYLKTAQGGTEATSGSAHFITSAYSLELA